MTLTCLDCGQKVRTGDNPDNPVVVCPNCGNANWKPVD